MRMAGSPGVSLLWPRWMAALLLILALTAAASASRADAFTDSRLREVAMWRAAALQLDVINGQRSEVSRAQALAQAVAEWRARPETISLSAEIAAFAPRGQQYLSLSWVQNLARWPTDEPPGVYAWVVAQELSAARVEFAYAMGAGNSPGDALARGARAYLLTNGITDPRTSFDNLSQDVAAAMAAGVRASIPGQLGGSYVPPAYPAPTYGSGSPQPITAQPTISPGYGIAARGGAINAAWAGLTGDDVSTNGSGRPDGVPDGQINLSFPGEGRVLKGLDVYRVDAQGGRTSTHWTSRSSGNWVLGAWIQRGKVNPSGPVDSLGVAAQPMALFVADDGTLRPGERFEVEATFTDGSTSKGHFIVGQGGGAGPGAPPPGGVIDFNAPPGGGPDGGYRPAPSAAIEAVWAGMGADEVSPNGSARPDGAADGQIQIRFAADGRFLKGLDVYGLDAQGGRTSTHWTSWSDGYWVLGVRARGLRLNPGGAVPNLSIPAQPLTLFVADDGSLRPGQRFEVEATFADGSTSKGYFAVGP